MNFWAKTKVSASPFHDWRYIHKDPSRRQPSWLIWFIWNNSLLVFHLISRSTNLLLLSSVWYFHTRRALLVKQCGRRCHDQVTGFASDLLCSSSSLWSLTFISCLEILIGNRTYTGEVECTSWLSRYNTGRGEHLCAPAVQQNAWLWTEQIHVAFEQ